MNILRGHVEPILKDALNSIGVNDSNWTSMLSPSREHSQGDLSLPCFPFAKQLGKSPNDIAEELSNIIVPNVAIGKINAIGGYLNFKAEPKWLAKQLLSGKIRVGDAFGNKPHTGRQILIEHTSANPNGPFHVGRARNAILGDTLVRLHRLLGNEVRAEYYVDDMGKQVGVLAWALDNLSKQDVEDILQDKESLSTKWSDKADHTRVRWYQAAQKLRKDESKSEKIEQDIAKLVHASEHGDESVLQKFHDSFQPVLDGMLETLSRLGIEFNQFTNESMFVTNGDVAKLTETLSKLEIHGVADNGAEYLDLGARGMKGKTEFFFKRGDGSSLYATRDIAYHIWKWKQCDDLINILGEDHKLQSKQVGMTLQELGHKVPEVLFYSFIKLPEGKMSTRKGNVVFMDDLLEEAKEHASQIVRELRTKYSEQEVSHIGESVGRSAIRFNIIKVSPDKGFTFRWEEALAFEAGSAPFIMYSHTRALSIAKKCIDNGIDVDEISNKELDLDSIDSELPDSLIDLLRCMAIQNDALERSVMQCRPNLFANQVLNLATSFNGFYRDCKIFDDGNVNELYLQVSQLASQFLKTGMEGLGITPLERM
ncbi:MAG: arginine--tRNA ligase [Candidatus Poseidoniales archaeon]|nr:MAG: arginine--tRNA ligase [Candidatus Poseidoniales archaeon]